MKIAKLYGWDENGNPKLYGTLWLTSAGVVTGDSVATERLLSKPLHFGGKDYGPADGEAFLDILPKAVSGAYMQAVVENVESGQPPAADAFATGRQEPVRHAKASRPSITPLMRELTEQAKRTQRA